MPQRPYSVMVLESFVIRVALVLVAALLLLPAAVHAAQADLSWTNPSGAQVRVERRDGPDTAAWVKQSDLSAGSTSFSQAGLLVGTRYCYRPVAFNPFGDAVQPWPEVCAAGNTPENVGGVILIIRP